MIREEIYNGILSNDIIGFHTRSYRRNFLQCCEDLLGLRGRYEARRRARFDGREVWVRAYPLPIDAARRAGRRRPGADARVRGTSCCAGAATI